MSITTRLAIVAAAILLSSALRADEPVRLRLKDGTGPIEARLIAWDFQTWQLTVELADGTRRELVPADLHDSDRKSITKLMQRQLAGRDQPSGPAPDPAGTGNSPAFTGPGTTRDLNLHGTHWLADRETALQFARGSGSATDDRPVLWFRVLGNLSGFM